LFGRFPERTPSGVVLSIRQLLAHADRRVVVAVQNSLLFSAGAESFLRKDLVSRGQIRAVVAMPAGLFDFTHIPFSVLVLDPAGGREQICFINADDPRFREPISKARCRLINLAQLVAHVDSGDESEVSKRIDCAEVLANDAQLQVSRYLLADTAKQLQAKLASADTVPLGDVVTTIRPMPIAKDNAGFTVMEVGAADLPRLGYITAPGRMLRVDRQVADKNALQFLRPLDIVLIVKGSVGKVGIVPPSIPLSGPGAWVAGQSAIVLRTSSKAGIDPRALAVQLRSPLGQELLRGIVSGASIPLIQVRELLRLHVLVPDPVTAERALEALDQEAELQREIDQLLKKQADVAADLWILD
jgi:type I restriction enzyme M protein